MAIQIYCPTCRASYKLDTKECPKCQVPFGRTKKFRVCVSFKKNRVTRFYDNLTLAREAETAIKADILRGDLDINQKTKLTPTLGEVWAKYLPWAKGEKKTWITDEFNYKKHLEPRFGRKRLDAITSIDVERMKAEMKKATNQQGKPYAKATIKHQLVLLNRLFNLAKRWRLYVGDNPVNEVEMPKLDNHRTEFLTEQEAINLAEVLDNWPCRDSVTFIRFTLLTGFRRSELFKLTWDDVDFERGMLTLKDPKGGKTESIPVSLRPWRFCGAWRLPLLMCSPAKTGCRERTSTVPGPGYAGPRACRTGFVSRSAPPLRLCPGERRLRPTGGAETTHPQRF